MAIVAESVHDCHAPATLSKASFLGIHALTWQADSNTLILLMIVTCGGPEVPDASESSSPLPRGASPEVWTRLFCDGQGCSGSSLDYACNVA